MSDIIQSGSPCYITPSHNNNHNQDTQKILESIGNASLHELNALGITNKAVSDNAQVTNKGVSDGTTSLLLAQAGTVDTIHMEGRNTDNKVSDAERAASNSFHNVAALIAESKFEFTKQLADLKVEVLNQGSKGRELLLSENLAELRSKACCCSERR